MRIAFLACPTTLPGSPSRRPDAFEHDLLFAALETGLAGRAELTAIDWRAPLAELTAFDLAYLGTPWDYTEAKDEFLMRLAALEAAGVDMTILDPRSTWADSAEYDATAQKLVQLFVDNFQQFTAYVDEGVRQAAPAAAPATASA